MHAHFSVNEGREFRDSSKCSRNRGDPLIWGPLNTGFTVLCSGIHAKLDGAQ